MPELFESSGLLSLAALQEHEKKRTQGQALAARARAEAEQRARLEAEQEAARLDRERQRAESVARDAAEAEQRAQQLRLHAAEQAEAERSSAWFRSATELRLALTAERDARRISELGLTAELLRQRLLTSLASAVCVGSWLAASGLYFGALRPAAERALGASQQALSSAQRARGDADAEALGAVRRAGELAARVEQ